MSKYGVFSGPNAGKYGPEKAPYLDTSRSVQVGFSGVLKPVCSLVRLLNPFKLQNFHETLIHIYVKVDYENKIFVFTSDSSEMRFRYSRDAKLGFC